MRRSICWLLFATIVLSDYALAGSQASAAVNAKVAKARKCLFPQSRKRAPVWVCDAHAYGAAVAAVGSAAKSKAGAAFTEQMAAADARAKIVQQLHGAGQPVAAASDASASEATLAGSKIAKHAYGPNGRLYVLMVLDESNAQKPRETTGEQQREK